MMAVIRVIGLLIACVGISMAVNPRITKRMLGFWRRGKRIYLGGAIRILIGLLFLFFASRAAVPAVIVTLGAVSLASGIFLLWWGATRVKKLFDWFDARSSSAVRLMSLIVIAFGVLIMASA
jgi:ribose/xylose/arabinose/galactoside ABC-type transport system permease subunit